MCDRSCQLGRGSITTIVAPRCGCCVSAAKRLLRPPSMQRAAAARWGWGAPCATSEALPALYCVILKVSCFLHLGALQKVRIVFGAFTICDAGRGSAEPGRWRCRGVLGSICQRRQTAVCCCRRAAMRLNGSARPSALEVEAACLQGWGCPASSGHAASTTAAGLRPRPPKLAIGTGAVWTASLTSLRVVTVAGRLSWAAEGGRQRAWSPCARLSRSLVAAVHDHLNRARARGHALCAALIRQTDMLSRQVGLILTHHTHK